MISFPSPSFSFDYDIEQEKIALRSHRELHDRKIPQKEQDKILIATWNIANLGLQKRIEKDYIILAEMISWFDLIALQEVYDNLEGLRRIQRYLPQTYKVIFNDKGGNHERAAFLYDSTKISLGEMIGEVAIPPSDNRFIRLENVQRSFSGFDRNPFVASFVADEFQFVLANVHLYFGGASRSNVERRSLEAYAIARWADLRHKHRYAYSQNIISLGDFNLPKVVPGDSVYEALRRRGLRRPRHSTRVASNIANDHHYDQIFFFPGPVKQRHTGKNGIFDFDSALFSEMYEERTLSQFRSFVRYHISDHRILWAQFTTSSMLDV